MKVPYFNLNGIGDMEKLETYYDELARQDQDLARIDKRQFRNYYALRASASVSVGSHDEWNIIRVINEKRRHDSHKAEFGIARQVGVLFDGGGLAPVPAETPAPHGYVRGCTP